MSWSAMNAHRQRMLHDQKGKQDGCGGGVKLTGCLTKLVSCIL